MPSLVGLVMGTGIGFGLRNHRISSGGTDIVSLTIRKNGQDRDVGSISLIGQWDHHG